MLLKGRIGDAWRHCDATFMAVLIVGILTSVFTLAKAISYLMTAHPVPLWAFFFGLVLVSVYLVGREVDTWRPGCWIAAILGLGLALFITLAAPLQLEADALTLFCAGAIAISAMLLPGISGSFILVLLGLYPIVLGAVKNLDLPILVVFSAGCLAGLLVFSKLLTWLLAHLKNLTMAFLSGLMLGSLAKVWPWKHTLTWQTNRHGESFPLHQENLWPSQFVEVTGQAHQLPLALGMAIGAAVLVLLLEWLARRKGAEQDLVR